MLVPSVTVTASTVGGSGVRVDKQRPATRSCALLLVSVRFMAVCSSIRPLTRRAFSRAAGCLRPPPKERERHNLDRNVEGAGRDDASGILLDRRFVNWAQPFD